MDLVDAVMDSLICDINIQVYQVNYCVWSFLSWQCQ